MTNELMLRAPSEIVINDPVNPRAVVNLLPTVVQQAVQDHLFTHAELFTKDERELTKLIKEQNAKRGSHELEILSPLDNRLRLKFWVEYDRATAHDDSMKMVNVLAGMCSKDMFYGAYIKNPFKMAWMLCPPTAYLVKAEEALEFGLEQLREILGASNYDAKGNLNTKVGELKAKIIAMLDNRVKGAVVQKTMNLNLNGSKTDIDRATEGNSIETLERQLKEVDRAIQRAKNLPLTVESSKSGPDIEIDPA